MEPHYHCASKLNNGIFQHGVSLSLCVGLFPKSSLSLMYFFYFSPHSRLSILMISMIYFPFFLYPILLRDSECMCEYLNVSVNTHACLSVSLWVCVGHQVLTPPWKPQKMWREICVDQDHKYSEVKVWSLSLSLSETSCRLRRHHSLWNWQHAWQWPHLHSHICHPSISPPFHLSIFPLN